MKEWFISFAIGWIIADIVTFIRGRLGKKGKS